LSNRSHTRALASSIGADATFVRAEVYDAPDVLGHGGFDLVYTGIGALCWLPDIRRWGRAATLSRPSSTPSAIQTGYFMGPLV
jgi:hypothetical protein